MKWFQDITLKQEIAFDRVWVIGDLHGCFHEFRSLIERIYLRPYVDCVVFVGDICDRGPLSFATLKDIMYYKEHGLGSNPVFNVLGNHDAKLLRALNGAKVQFTHGLDKTWAEIQEKCSQGDKDKIREFLQSTPLTIQATITSTSPLASCVIAHAGFDEQFAGYRGPWLKGHTVEYAIFGPTDGTLADGFPNRIPWEDDYDDYEGAPYVFYGHKVMGPQPKFTSKTCGLDTGCWESGILTAVSYPDLQVVQSTDPL